MGNPYYQAGPGRADKVNELFDTIAARYDRINDLQSLGFHRLWKRRLVELSGCRPGQAALDVCCGTGDIARLLAQRGLTATGLDFSAPMLVIARQRAEQAGLDKNIQFLQGDALRLPFAEHSFDLVTVGYGLRNLASVEGGLAEMLRVAKVGGRLLVLEFGWPDNPWLRLGYRAYLKWGVPVFGRLFCGNAATYGYILESLEHYPAQRGVAEIMERLGCVRVAYENLMGGAMAINWGERGR